MKNTIFNYDKRRPPRFTRLVNLEKMGKEWYIIIDKQCKKVIRDTKPVAMEWAKQWAIDNATAITFDPDLWLRLVNEDEPKFKTA